ncbi:MAG: sugar ABC transporter ATP-binding protein [Clostridiales bacterium]|nr:sugar ABC transporter ATP-binding protein [Clostridiales bacterium]
MDYEILRIEDLIVEMNGIKILKDYNLNIKKGESVGIFVKTTSEKDSLIQVLEGKLQPLKGRIYLEDRECSVEALRKEFKQSIYTLDSKSKLIDKLSVADNLFIVRGGFQVKLIRDGLLREQTQKILEELKIEIPPRTSIYHLTKFERIQVELAKAYGLGAKLVILREVSSYMSDSERNVLFEMVHYLKTQGISFLIIDSFVQVLSQFSDRIVLMKNGKNIWVVEKDEFKGDLIKSLELNFNHTNVTQKNLCERVFSLNDIETNSMKSISFSIKRGEVVSIVDHFGTGMAEFSQLLTGDLRHFTGEMSIGNKLYKPNNLSDAFKQGLYYIGYNPTESMLFNDLKAIDNLCFSVASKINMFWFSKKYRRIIEKDYLHYFESNSLELYPQELSIYDRLRLVYLRCLIAKPSVVVIQRPFSSVNQELKDLTFELINHLTDEKISVMILTTIDSEVKMISKRIEIQSKE